MWICLDFFFICEELFGLCVSLFFECYCCLCVFLNISFFISTVLCFIIYLIFLDVLIFHFGRFFFQFGFNVLCFVDLVFLSGFILV